MSELIPIKLYGVNKDKEASELPLDVFSNISNMRFNDGNIEKVKGYTQVFGTPSIAPLKLQNLTTSIVNYWIYAGLSSVYVTDGSTHTDITPTATISTTLANRWNTTFLNGVPILNNKSEAPIWWNGSPASPMTAIPGWISGDMCDVIRSYKTYLFALGVTESGIKYPHKIKWSNAANPGSLPSSWTPLTTNDAGDANISETPDPIIDGLTLRDMFVLYKQNSTYSIRYTGGRYVFKIESLFGSFGCLAEGCVVEYDQQHCVLTSNDLVQHDGNSFTSVIDEEWRSYLFSQINNDVIDTCFLQLKYDDDEIWICYPSGSSIIPNKVIVWNYREKNFHERDLPACYDISSGVVANSAVAADWDSDTDSWDSDTTVWDEKLYSATSDSLLIAGYSDTKMYHLDNSSTFDGNLFSHYVERVSMPLVNNTHNKLISALWPNVAGPSGTEITIQVGSQQKASEPISWSPSQTFIIGTTDHIDAMIEGKYISVKFSSTTSNSWKLYNFMLDTELMGVH